MAPHLARGAARADGHRKRLVEACAVAVAVAVAMVPRAAADGHHRVLEQRDLPDLRAP